MAAPLADNPTLRLFILLLGRILSVLCSVILIKVMTSLLSPEEVGRYSIVASLIGIFTFIFISPIGSFINRRINAWRSAGILGPRLKAGLLYLGLVVTAIASCAYLIGWARWFGISMNPWLLLVIVAGTIGINTINTTLAPGLNLLGHPSAFVILSTISQWLSFGAAAVFVWSWPQAESWLLGSMIGLTVATVLVLERSISLLGGLKGPIILPDRTDLRRVLEFSWPIFISVSSNWVQTQAYRLFIGGNHLGRKLDLKALGLFVAGFGLGGNVAVAYEQVMTQYLQPRFYAEVETTDLASQTLAWNTYAAGLFPGTLLLMGYLLVSASVVVKLLLGAAFQQTSRFIVLGALSETSRAYGAAFSLVAHARQHTVPMVVPSLTSAAMSIFGVFFLGQALGGSGLGMALMGANLAYAVFMYLSVRSKLAIVMPWKKIGLALVLSAPLFIVALFQRERPITSVIMFGIATVYFAICQLLSLKRSS